MSDCYLTPHEEYFSYIMARTILPFNAMMSTLYFDDVHFGLHDDVHFVHR